MTTRIAVTPDYVQALGFLDDLLTRRPDLRPAAETLYAKAWPETIAILAALASEVADSAKSRQDEKPLCGPEVAQ